MLQSKLLLTLALQYADPVCDRIDPSGHFKHRLFRESCVCFKSNYIKHLAVLGRDIEQICIIDNSPVSFYFHRQNAVRLINKTTQLVWSSAFPASAFFQIHANQAEFSRQWSYVAQITNASNSFLVYYLLQLQIVAWYDDPTDTALLDLIPYLKGLAEAPSVLEYVSQYAPPPSAAIAQPDLSPCVFGAPGFCNVGGGWGGYNDEEEEDEDEVGAEGLHDTHEGCQGEEEEERLHPSHNIIAMAPRPAGEVVTAT